MSSYVLLLSVSLLTCAGQLCQKWAAHCWPSTNRGRMLPTLRWLAAALILLGLGMLLWLRVLQHMPLSQAYPLLSFNFIIVTLAGQFFFDEKVTPRHWLGIAAIMFGVLLLSWHP